MGLDFAKANSSWTSDSPHWSYGGFHRFRVRLANAAGYTVGEDMFKDGSVAKLHKDALWPLISHSDCDGELSVAEMKKVEPRLRAIVSLWPEDDYDRVHAFRLCDRMLECIADNKPLEFC